MKFRRKTEGSTGNDKKQTLGSNCALAIEETGKLYHLPKASDAVVYSIDISAANSEIAPRKVNAAYRTVCHCVIIVPGCMTHARIDISAMVMPLDWLFTAFLLKTCPKKDTKIVTNDNSMLLARAAQRSDAVAGDILPVVVTCRPQRGRINATANQRPEPTVE